MRDGNGGPRFDLACCWSQRQETSSEHTVRHLGLKMMRHDCFSRA
jgi:hypothetical protein